MVRFYGSMWGAFLCFRLIFLLVGPLFIRSKAATTLAAVWGGAPLGILAAEWGEARRVRRARMEEIKQD